MKRKIRPHPGALAGLLRSRDMTQMDAASVSGIDRKTLAKIDRGEEVKEETLQKLAKKLNVPATHFEPPATDSANPELTQPKNSRWLNLMARNVDTERLVEMLSATEQIIWKLNVVHALDDEAIQFLEQVEDAVKNLHAHLTEFYVPDPDEYGSLRCELAKPKKIRQLAGVLEQLAQHRVAIIGAEYLHWSFNQEIQYHDEDEYHLISYKSCRSLVLSIEAHQAQQRRVTVWQGTVPPKLAPNKFTIITVNGIRLDDDEIPILTK